MTTRLLARAGTAIAVNVGLAIAASGPAAAADHDRFPVEFHGSGTVDCVTFQDHFVDDLYGQAMLTYDDAGQPVRLVIHWTHTSTDSNSVTGLTLHEHGHFTETIDLVTGTDTTTGNFEILNRHGYGAIIQDTGRVVYDADGNVVFFAGGPKHNELIQGDQLFCDGLA